MVMRRDVISGPLQGLKIRVACGAMALGTDRIAFGNKGAAVRIMTVGAAHTLRIHLALQEGAIDIDLIIDLPVGVIEPPPEKRKFVVIG